MTATTGRRLRLTDVWHRGFPDGTDDLRAPDIYDYFADITDGRDLGHRPERVTDAAGTSFASMARVLAADLAGRPSGGEPVDLAIVARATPDFDPRSSGPVALTALLPGEPLSFCVGGTGRLATFAALRLAAAHAARHDLRRVLVLAMDQGAMAYDLPDPVDDAATVLVLEAPEREPEEGVEVITRRGVDVGDADAVLDDVLRTLPVDPAVLVRGAGLGTGSTGSPRLPCSGPWAALAAAQTPVPRPVVLADHDRAHRELAVCAVW